MRTLLDNSTRRRLELLEYLNDAANWVSSNELASSLDASLRTINSDIQYLKEHWYDYITIETSKKNGVRLTTPPNKHVQLIYQEVVKKSDNFLLLEKMFFYPTKNLEDWENELYLSYSSLYRTSQLINDIIIAHDLELKKAPFHISNKNEVKVRYFFINYFNEVYFTRDWPFSVDRQLVTSLAIDIAECFFNIPYQEIDDIMIIYLGFIIAVSLTRYSQGFTVEHTELKKGLQPYKAIVTGKEQQLEKLAQFFDIAYDNALIEDLVLSIYLFNLHSVSPKKWEQLSEKIDTFITEGAAFLNVNPTDEDRYLVGRVFKAIYLHHVVNPKKEDVLYNQYLSNAKLIINNYPGYANYIKFKLKQLEQDTKFPWYSNYYEHIIYWLMIKWKNLAILIDQKKVKANILVISDLGKDHTLFMANLLEHNFGNKAAITPCTAEVYTMNDFNSELWESYDAIISNFKVEEIPEDKLIIVNTFPDNQEWAKIRAAINKAHQLAPELLESIIKLDDEESSPNVG